MLRKIRLSLAIIVFATVTLLFLDFSGTLHAWFGWMAKIQFIPAILALNVAVVVGLVVLTLLLGRVYCSIICPLGVLQDFVAWIGRRGKKRNYTYSPPKTWIRYGILILFVAALIGGVGAIYAILEPYSAYGRIVNNLFLPVWQWGNNLLALASERMDSYAFYETEVWLRSLPTLLVAATTLVIIAIMAWRNGRAYCNTICPVGTLLGAISKYSLMRIKIDNQKCNKCGLCEKNCKASCIDSKEFYVDNNRCVSCMNCLDKCRKNAIGYKLSYSKCETTDSKKDLFVQNTSSKDSRRGFLSAVMILAASAVKSQIIPKATDIKMDGGFADIVGKIKPSRQTAITPAGSVSARNMNQHCTACQLCITACPNGVMQPSSSFDNFMQPCVEFDKGYCRPECVKCSEVCPTSAIKKISKEEKSSTQIGHAVWLSERCVPLTIGDECDNCARHCPTDAITMILSDAKNPESIKIPSVNEERCIGCGACENLCPSRPISAIYVEGHTIHKLI